MNNLEEDEYYIYGWSELTNTNYIVSDHDNFISKSKEKLAKNILSINHNNLECWFKSCSIFVGTKLIIKNDYYVYIKYKCDDEIHDYFNKYIMKIINLK